MNNSVKTLIVRSFNEGHQGLLERHIPSEWGGLGEREGGGGEVSPKEGIFFGTEK